MAISRLKNTLLISGLVLMMIASCQKDEKINSSPSVKLSFSADTIIFDTVFTTIGSITKEISVYNKESEKIVISSINLAGGNNSRYSINVDGVPGTHFNDVEIGPNDSIFVFARVNINPGDADLPFIVTDSIVFETNGNIQDVDLVAWGQNANFILWDTDRPGLPKYKIVAAEGVDTTWTKSLPIVVYGYAVVDSTGSLTIEPGTKVHFHSGSGLWIYKGGSLKVLGTLEEPVYFQSDRLDGFYQYLPGQWDRIWINEGAVDNVIEYAVIRNGFIGLQLETLQEYMGNQLFLNNTIIENMSGAGILTRFYLVASHNCVFTNCGQYALALTLGGSYDFRHVTIGNYWNYTVRTTPSIYVNNYYLDQNNQAVEFPFNGNFANSIIYGNQREEIVVDDMGNDFTLKFDHCLLKTEKDINESEIFINSLKNQDPLFVDYTVNDLQLDSISPARDIGKIEIANTVPTDLKGVDRLESPDIGAYEWIPVIEIKKR
ncbi:MAG TPA: choice-of-anchor Q domain-containing protein [Bacteroidales bacterium]|nr:choice-of-anchor Q domain-containing protein [Bacteroidales bacterium]